MADSNVSIGFTATGDAVIATVNRLDGGLVKLGETANRTSIRVEKMSSVIDNMGARGVSSTVKLASGYQRQTKAMDDAYSAAVLLSRGTDNLTRSTLRATGGIARVGAETRRTSGNMRDASVASMGFEASLARFAGKAALFLGIGTGVAAVGMEMRKVITDTVDFGDAMAGVAAVGGLQKGQLQFEELAGAAKDVGATTRFTATQAAQGLRELVAAGMSATQSMTSLKDVVDLSIAGEMDMARASEIVVASLSAFGLQADETARISDVLARAANASPAAVNDLGESLKFVAPVASALNTEIEDVGAALTILANNGIKGGMAGRGLTAVLSRMVAPTKEVLDVLDQLGVRADTLNPSIVGLEGSFRALTQFDQKTLVKMFGAENLDISNILANGAAQFPALAAQMRDTSITAKGMAATMDNTLKGAFFGLNSALESTRIAMGEVFEGDLETITRDVTQWIRDNKDGFVDLASAVKEIGPPLLKIVTAYVALRAGMIGVKTALSVGKWIAETAAILANTTALMRNATARSELGFAALTKAGVGKNIAYAMNVPIGEMLSREFGKGTTKAAVGRGVAALGSVVAAAIGGWEIGSAVERAFDLSGKLERSVYGELDGLTDHANKVFADLTSKIQNAGNEGDLAEAKAQVQQAIYEWQDKLVGLTGKERESVIQTVAILEAKLRTADAVNARAQESARLSREEAEARRQAQVASEIALANEEKAAAAMRRRNDRMEETGKMASGIASKLFSSADADVQLFNVEREERRILGVVNYYRKQVNALAADAGTSVVNGDKEIRNVDEVVAYFHAAMKAARASGDEGFLGSTQLNFLAKLATASQELSEKRRAATSKTEKDDKDERRRMDEKRELMRDIAIAEARAAGDDRRAKRLEREAAILREKKRIMDSMGVSESKALALASRKVNAEEAAKRRDSRKEGDRQPQVVASSLAEIGGGGGVYFAGLQTVQDRQLSAAEQQVRLLNDISLKLGVDTLRVSPPNAKGTVSVEQLSLLSRMASALETINERGKRGGSGASFEVQTL